MNIVIGVISCYAYRDTWKPFFSLFRKFWPFCPYPVYLLSDILESFDYVRHLSHKSGPEEMFCWPNETWCGIAAKFAEQAIERHELILLIQDDFFLSAPPVPYLIERAAHRLIDRNAGCVRLYPCPGADAPDDPPDPHYGLVSPGAPYRISCQVALWRPDYLLQIASHTRNTPADFEIKGSNFSNSLPDPIYAFNRDVQPWPIQYLCSAISRGKWTKEAREFCRRHDVSRHLDWSMRPTEGEETT